MHRCISHYVGVMILSRAKAKTCKTRTASGMVPQDHPYLSKSSAEQALPLPLHVRHLIILTKLYKGLARALMRSWTMLPGVFSCSPAPFYFLKNSVIHVRYDQESEISLRCDLPVFSCWQKGLYRLPLIWEL